MVSFSWVLKFMVSLFLDGIDLLALIGNIIISLTGVGIPVVFTGNIFFKIFYLLIGLVFYGKRGFLALIEFIPFIGNAFPALTVAALISPKD